ncbi:MarR family transcriptional regulator [Ramlibacter sp. XY19]|uniref:MarR family winged helix-turn-helix transcriptional regulator n=1 Tax=Ramlibacter paludis TaxID=2908000 RepID=UPI0023D9DC51|nr:MarR family transcriptional regulator [Ramlibacter paludis]MCG2591528.1 MarR family transcriptional regulator [Ramlibacter paludis]
MKTSFDRRFGFLVTDVARQYGQQFDRAAREKLGLSQAQVRLLAVLAAHEDDQALSQAELALRLGLTPMGVASLCDRMATAGWIERRPRADDRRINELHMLPSARKAMDKALAIGDELTTASLAGLSAAERTQLLALLGKAREGLLKLAGGEAPEEE